MKVLQTKLVIAAALSAGFTSTIGRAKTLIGQVQGEAGSRRAQLGNIQRLAALAKEGRAHKKVWSEKQAAIAALRKEMAASDQPSKTLQTRFKALANEAGAAKTRYNANRNAARLLRAQMDRAGQSTKSWAQETKRLSRELKLLETHQIRSAALNKKIEANRQRRGELQGKVIGTAALAASLAAPLFAASAFESKMADVRKVLNDLEDPVVFKSVQKDILDLSRQLPIAASGIADIYAQGARAGLARSELKGLAQDVVKMSIAFDMSEADAASAMTGFRTQFGLTQSEVVSLGDAINVLDNNMDATAANITRVTQRSAGVAKQFGLSAQANAAFAASFLALKTRPEVAGTAMNAMLQKLATADQQGSKFQAAMDKIGISALNMKDMIKQDAEGALVSFLDAVASSEDQLPILNDLFGLEYADNVAVMTGNLGVFKGALKLANDEQRAAGAMQREFESRAATSANELQLFKNSANVLAISLGTVLLPGLVSVSKAGASMAGGLADLTQKYPLVTKVVMTAVFALVALRVVTLASALSWTLLKGAWLTAGKQLLWLQGKLLLLNLRLGVTNGLALASAARMKVMGAASMFAAKGGIRMLAVGVRALTVAMLANPIGAIIAGVAALGVGAFLLIKNWTKVKTFFFGLWGKMPGTVKTAFGFIFKAIKFHIDLIMNVLAKPLGLIKKIKGFFSKKKQGNIAVDVSSNDERRGPGAGPPPPPPPPSQGPRAAVDVKPAFVLSQAGPVIARGDINNEIHLHGVGPASDPVAMARELQTELVRLQDEDKERQLHD